MTIDDFCQKKKLKQYLISQFNKEFYQNLILSFDELFGWPKNLREDLKKEVPFSSLKEIKRQVSRKGDTEKILFERKDKLNFETVLMRHADTRNTVCVSSMVGCPVGCRFCATGKLGFIANLTFTEIIDQILHFARILKNENKKISNVVFMGQGEPLLNLSNVEKAISILTDQKKMGFSPRRVTVSTSGYLAQLKKFLADGFSGSLALSLHAPNQEIREKIMPTAAKLYSIDELLSFLDFFYKKRRKAATFEYILIKGVNSGPKEAEMLARLFKKHRLHILNLIPCNHIKGGEFEPPTSEEIQVFTGILRREKIPFTCRVTMGEDISAACGQLANN